jgi:hypothetical protein
LLSADVAASTTRDAIVTRSLRLPPGALLADIACGRGGCGIENARRASARRGRRRRPGAPVSAGRGPSGVSSPGALRRVLATATAP